MAVFTWTGAVSDDWNTAANWSPATVPQGSGDTALIPPGTSTAPTISAEGVSCAMTLGQADTGSVALNVAAAFGATPMTICGEGGVTALDVTLSIQQACFFSGQIRIMAPGSTVTITAPDTTFTAFTFAEAAFVLVAPGSTLNLVAGRFTTAGLLEIAGAVSIASGVTVLGSGLLAIENGGHLAISGSVLEDQQIAFADGTGFLTLSDPAAFQGTIGFASVAGGLIELPGISAQSLTLTAQAGSETVFVMTLYAGQNGSGGMVATLNVNLLDEEALTAISNPGWTAGDFAITSIPASATMVTYAPQGTLSLQQSLPATIVAAAGTPVLLSTIFQNAFGTQEPGFYSITLPVLKTPANTPTDHKYWSTPNVAPAWLNNGKPITTAQTIKVSDIGAYSLQVGNNILYPAQFQAQVTQAAIGQGAETVIYSVWTVDPSVAQGTPGVPQASDVVLAAQALNAAYPDVPNTNLCNWIADSVAAAAGVPMPLPDAQLDPINNVDGGFWRIAYRGDGKTPYEDWGTEVLAGDIVRMEWESQPPGALSGHSTTILVPPTPLPPIPPIVPSVPMLVYDNAASDPSTGQTMIAVHAAHYWVSANPASITIYRLDPKGQYLIYGSPLGEIIQGSPYNNLIIPGGGADIITAGPGNNEIKGTKAELAAITVTDFDAGDVLNFTDLVFTTATASFNGTVLQVFDNGPQVATIPLPGLSAGASFNVSSNLQGGTLIALAS